MTNYSTLYREDHWFEQYKNELPFYDNLIQRKNELSQQLNRDSVRPFYEYIDALDSHNIDFTQTINFSQDTILFGEKEEIRSDEQQVLIKALRALMPWRKGPWCYYGTEIDAEWRSCLKWNRFKQYIPDLTHKKVIDIGCNNLYYMYRMLDYNPSLVLGIDPVIKYYFHYILNQKIYPVSQFKYELLGVEDIDLFPGFFDVAFFMGILYHRRNPIDCLTSLNKSLKKDGIIFVECCGIPGENEICLFPKKRYMKAPGYWFLPTESALFNMLERTGFTNIEIIDSFKLEEGEQRQTDWARFQSLEHFLNPQDKTLTVEGYPAPVRIYMKAQKK